MEAWKEASAGHTITNGTGSGQLSESAIVCSEEEAEAGLSGTSKAGLDQCAAATIAGQ